MHYYQFNIGDYAKHTSHLTPIEHAAYRLLLDRYYLNEKPLESDVKKLSRLIGMSDYIADVEQVLEDFFTKTDDGFINSRCDKEIEQYQSKADVARANGRKGGRPKKPSDNQEETQSVILANQEETESQANHKPLTNNQEPLTNNHKPVNNDSEQVQLLFEFWQKVMNKSNVKLSAGRKSKITARLKDYSFDEISQAIENCSKSKFHMGMNDNNKQYNDIELICRNCEKLESFRDMPVIPDQLQSFSAQEQRNIINSQEWLNEQ